jgi:hypothetical protein
MNKEEFKNVDQFLMNEAELAFGVWWKELTRLERLLIMFNGKRFTRRVFMEGFILAKVDGIK